ncbi:MAG: uroporphyrinogen decarboxylase family protein [Deltaproteobacteria bacterium]|nr:uroporphyrinogen decarboxylase family protein [Deltaproteobacteria bacterium]
MNAKERMEAAINLKPVDKVPNAPFYEAPVCKYFGSTFKDSLLKGPEMLKAHMKGLEEFKFDWVMLGMGLIGGIIPEALDCQVSYPEDVFPIIEKTSIFSMEDIKRIAGKNMFTKRMDSFLEGVSLLKKELKDEVPIACEYISPFTIATRLRGTNEIMMDMYDNPELVQALQEAIVPLDIAIGKALIDAGVKYIFYGADMECPILLSPKHYKEFVHEPTTRVCNELSRCGAKVLPHMCGDIVKTGIVDLLLEMDIHGIMPGNLTQEKVLDIRELKKKVKDRICIFDNINPNGPLLIGKPEEVAQETLSHLNKAKGMTGYIFSTAGTSSPFTPKENYLSMDREVITFQWN